MVGKASKRRGHNQKLQQPSKKGKEVEDGSIYNVFEAEDEDSADDNEDAIGNPVFGDESEIDSDDAFDEGDEEKYADYKKILTSSTRDDSEEMFEEEGDEEEEEEEGMVDLSEMLSMNSEDEDEEEEKEEVALKSPSNLAFTSLTMGDNQDSSEEDSDDDDDVLAGMGRSDSEEDSSTEDEDEDEDSDNNTKLDKLDGFVTSISSSAQKRRFVSEAGGEFNEDMNTIGSGLTTKGVTLGIDDLLGSLAEDNDNNSEENDNENTKEGGEEKTSRQVRLLREQIKKLDRAAEKSGSGVVAAPLAKRLQDQVDRKVAYEQAKILVSEWQPAVDANRQVEHLSFPLNKGQRTVMSTASMTEDQGTTNDMESQINSILAESGMTDEQQQKYEELELKSLSPEEIRERQRELRMMRELMFRSERKAKRMAKIKSKAYRRILKKDKERAKEKAMEKIKEEDPEMYAMMMEKMARSRAEERMTLRHKNTSKWAREMSKRSHGDEDTQQALRDQLEMHDNLKRKIHDIGSEEELDDFEAGKTAQADGSSDDSDSEHEDMSVAAIKARALKKLAAEQSNIQNGDDDELSEGTPNKGLYEMPFMKKGTQRRMMEAAQKEIDDFEALEADEDEDGNVVGLRTTKPRNVSDGGGESKYMAPGRMAFGGGDSKKKRASEEDSNIDESSKRVRLNEAGRVEQVESGGGHRVRLTGSVSVNKTKEKPADNPWLADDSEVQSLGQRGGKLNELTKESSKIDKLSAKLRAQRKGGSAGGNARIEDSVMLDINKTLNMHNPTEDDDEEGMELEHVDNKKHQRTMNPNAFSQRDLVEQAFAEDNIVEEEFAAEKETAMEDEAPKDVDLTLPGWGSWGGASIQSSKKKVVRKAVEGSGVVKNKRLDAKMGQVIINQKRAKSSEKYYASNVPFPFYTSKQYEETLQAPLGKNWNTARSYSKMIKPRIMTKAGQIINPLQIPSKKHQ